MVPVHGESSRDDLIGAVSHFWTEKESDRVWQSDSLTCYAAALHFAVLCSNIVLMEGRLQRFNDSQAQLTKKSSVISQLMEGTSAEQTYRRLGIDMFA